MPFNNDKNGYVNELDFVKSINNKSYQELDYMFQLFINDLFGEINHKTKIKCWKNIKAQKYDIIISLNNVIQRISIKKGVKNSVHAEPISEFIHFLIENKMPRKLIINFLKYHYADGTTNGTGTKRMNISEYKIEHQDEIDEINKFINQKHIIIKAIERFILKGRNSNDYIDAIIYGVPEDFIWIKKEDIYNILLLKRNLYSTSIHFSSLTYQPLNRCINRNSKYEKTRFISQIKWYNISDDIFESMNNNLMKSRK